MIFRKYTTFFVFLQSDVDMKIGINGVLGRMGQEIARIINSDTSLTLAAEIDRDYSNIKTRPDVWIDFSSESGLLKLLEISNPESKIVSGTTGISTETFEKLKKQNRGVVWGSNMSFGVNLLFAIAQNLASVLDSKQYDAEIYERHHRMKKDAPSGTALTLGRKIAEGRGVNFEDIRRDYSTQGERKTGEIGFAVERGGVTVGYHEVSFISDVERIWVGHEALDRKIFAEGAVKIAKIAHQSNLQSYREVHEIFRDILRHDLSPR